MFSALRLSPAASGRAKAHSRSKNSIFDVSRFRNFIQITPSPTEIPLYLDEEYTEEYLEERSEIRPEYVPESDFATSNDPQRLKREDSDHLESVFELMELMIEKSHGLFDSQMDLLNKVVD